MSQDQNTTNPYDCATEEGRAGLTKVMMAEERMRFIQLQRQFIKQIASYVLRKEMEQALCRMERAPDA